MFVAARRLGLTAVALLTAVVLAACSGAGANGSTAPTVSGKAGDALQAAYRGVYQEDSLPRVAFPKAEQNVAIISCSQIYATCANEAQGVSDAVTAAGWWPTVYDGGGPEAMAAALRAAVANASTLVMVLDANCAGYENYLDEVTLARIPVIGIGGADDCTTPRWAATTKWTKDYPTGARETVVGKLQADYAFGKLGGDVKALVLTQTNMWPTTKMADGFSAELKKLGGGKVVQTLDLSTEEISNKSFVAKVVDAAVKSGANSIIVPEDDWLTKFGLVEGLATNKTTAKMVVVGHGGTAAALDVIRSGVGGFTATVGQAYDWLGWGAVDAAVRVLNGVPQVYLGDYIQVVDKDHNMPKSGPYTGPRSARDTYMAAWIISTPSPEPTPTPTESPVTDSGSQDNGGGNEEPVAPETPVDTGPTPEPTPSV